MSEHQDPTRNASGDSVNPESEQPMSRRERRLLEAASAQPTLEPTPISAVTFDQRLSTIDEIRATPAAAPVVPHAQVAPVSPSVQAPSTGPVPRIEPTTATTTGPVPTTTTGPVPTATTTGPIPVVTESVTAPIQPVTAPDVATLTPLEPAVKQASGRRRRGGAARETRTRLRASPFIRRKLPQVGRALRWAASEARSSTQRVFIALLIGAFFVSFTLPSTGFNMDMPGFAATHTDDGQKVEAASAGDVAAPISLDSFRVNNFGKVYGWSFGGGNWSYTINKTGPIRWPFLFAAPISSGFGSRSAPCARCTNWHTGLDFNPDRGTDIHAVAAGVVIEEENLHYSYGRYVVIHHDVNGMQFDTRYAHMIPNSVTLKVGDHVDVGDYVGQVGNTGKATGDHLHLEVIIDGQPVDPFTWLKKYAKP